MKSEVLRITKKEMNKGWRRAPSDLTIPSRMQIFDHLFADKINKALSLNHRLAYKFYPVSTTAKRRDLFWYLQLEEKHTNPEKCW